VKRRRTLIAILVASVVAVALIEFGAWLLVRGEMLAAPRPGRGAQGFWRGQDPRFGVWHAPNSSHLHRRDCFEARYTTNSIGARDSERSLRSARPRAVVLGDSFLEGWGVTTSHRLSNRLEAATGVEHLNFAMAHFSPYQSYLVYRTLATDFEHDAVLIGILPSNDFTDLDLELARSVEGYSFRYRPYLVGEPPDFRHFDHRESALHYGLRNWSYAGSALLAGIDRRRARSLRQERQNAGGDRPRSYFYDFRERDIARLEAVLALLAQQVADKPLVVVLIPTRKDLERRAVSGGDPLSARLQGTAERLGFQLVSLLGPMADHSESVARYFHSCDYHWSASGHRVAAELLLDVVEPEFYGDGLR
jgi:hypothetical protein